MQKPYLIRCDDDPPSGRPPGPPYHDKPEDYPEHPVKEPDKDEPKPAEARLLAA